MIFRVDAPPVATEEMRAATDEEDEEISSRTTTRSACSAPRRRAPPPRRGTMRLTLDPSRFHYFDPASGLAIDRLPAGT